MTDIQLVLKFADFVMIKLQELNIVVITDILDEDELNSISIDYGHPFSFKEQTLEYQTNDGDLFDLVPIYSGELGDNVLYGFTNSESNFQFYNSSGFDENDFKSAFEALFLKPPTNRDKFESTKRLISQVLALNPNVDEIGLGMLSKLRQLAMESENELELNFKEGVEE